MIYFSLTLFRKKIFDNHLLLTWLFVFFITSYITWQSLFSIMRYAVVLDMLAPCLIYLLLILIFRDAKFYAPAMFCCGMFIVLTMVPTVTIRSVWYGDNYFDVRLPILNANINSTVLVAYPAYAQFTVPRPQTYLIPFFPKQWQFIGVPFFAGKYQLSDRLRAVIQSRADQQLYLLSSEKFIPQLFMIAQQLGYTKKECSVITSDRQRVTHESVSLCAVRK